MDRNQDLNQQPQPQVVRSHQPRIYLGKPENQKDPRAIIPDAQRLAHQQAPKAGARKKTLLPRTLNRPTNVPTAQQLQNVQLSTDDPARNTLFSHGMNVREVNADTRFTPATASLIEVSRDTYREFITDDQNFHKAMAPEFLDYYATAMLWFRITALKRAARDCLTVEETVTNI
ncbi:unnamed protein product [Lasius platythorax]|uniref:Mfs monosaccharide n=2 Tax=Lasius TaxID=488720 RepID=A0A0J7KHM0_LASNI|nr:mfs monosaccharide [Lasius niger]